MRNHTDEELMAFYKMLKMGVKLELIITTDPDDKWSEHNEYYEPHIILGDDGKIKDVNGQYLVLFGENIYPDNPVLRERYKEELRNRAFRVKTTTRDDDD